MANFLYKRTFCVLIVSLFCIFLLICKISNIEIHAYDKETANDYNSKSTNRIDISKTAKNIADGIIFVNRSIQDDIKSETSPFDGDDISLIAWIMMGEAEGESEEGKRLVIDTILNRIDNDNFPNSVYEVIYQPYQFSCVWDGRLDRTYINDDAYNLVISEINNRSNYDVLYFTSGEYGEYGTELFQVGNHYFCGE